jgi:hypothetical protein
MKKAEQYTSYHFNVGNRKMRFNLYLDGSIRIAVSKCHPGFEADALESNLVRASFGLMPSDISTIKTQLEVFKKRIASGDITP